MLVLTCLSRDLFVFRGSLNPSSMTLPDINGHLKLISIALGLERRLTSDAFRHFVARCVYLCSEY